jgi:hypothetical protein
VIVRLFNPSFVSEAQAINDVRVRTMPDFESMRYGTLDYLRLRPTTAREIARGAEDESEMSVYHDLFEPQRTAPPCSLLACSFMCRPDSTRPCCSRLDRPGWSLTKKQQGAHHEWGFRPRHLRSKAAL